MPDNILTKVRYHGMTKCWL